MKTLLTCNLSTGVVTLGEEAWTPRAYVFEEQPAFAFRFTEEVDGETIDRDFDIQSLRMVLGTEDARPESETWALQIGGGPQTPANTTAALGYDATAEEVQGAINALASVTATYGVATVRKQNGSWRIVLGDGAAPVPMRVVGNFLEPLSFGRISRYQVGSQWRHEVRLVQAPLAVADGVNRVLPDAPSLKTIRDGGGAGETSAFDFGEIQELTVPPDFRAAFYLQTTGGQQTVALDRTDDAASVQAALETLLGVGNILVTNPQDFRLQLEWAGDLVGIDQAELLVVPLDPPPGDPTLVLDLGQYALQAALQRSPTVVAPLEVRMQIKEADGTLRKVQVLKVNLQVQRSNNFAELALVPRPDYLRPPSPEDYVPFVPTNVITGHQYSTPAVVGNGTATEFNHDHGFDSEVVVPVVRENTSNGLLLANKEDYTVRFTDSNSFKVTSLVGAPATAAWVIYAHSAKTVSAFAAGLHITTGQVDGLDAQFTTLQAALTALQAQAAVEPLGIVRPLDASPVTIEIPDWQDLFPGNNITKDNGVVNLASLKSGNALLPALHKATVTSLTALPLPTVSAAAGNVHQNNTGAALLLPGGLGTRSSYVSVGGFFGSDGRRLYPLTHEGTTTSYFPRDFERPLFEFAIDSTMLRAGTRLTLSFTLALQLLKATSRAQYVLVLEHAAIQSQSTPAATAPNLSAYAWEPVALLRQTLGLGDNRVSQSFGAEIIRAANGTLSANKVINGKALAAGSVPTSATFALRGRLIDFDTENSALNAVGAVYITLSSAKAEIQ